MSDKQNEIIAVEIASLNRGCTQLRCKMNLETVTRYAEKYTYDQDGHPITSMPPVVVFKDGKGSLHLADGFHRTAGAEKSKHTHVMADVRDGTEKDAILYAAGCNDANGLTWTNKDKDNAVRTLLRRWPKWSDRKIASYCCCSHPFVAKIRKKLEGKPDPKTEKVKKEPKDQDPVDDTKNRLSLLIRASQEMAKGVMEIAMGWVDTETGERKPFMGCRDDIQWEDGRKAIERAIRDVHFTGGPGNIEVWREKDSIRFTTYYTGGERQAASDTWNENGVEVKVTVRVFEGYQPEPDDVIDTVAVPRLEVTEADQSEDVDAGDYDDVEDSQDPLAEFCEAASSKLTSMLNKPKRGRGRPKLRFDWEKTLNGYYVVDREGEVDDEGPFKTKQDADNRRKELNAEVAS